MFFLLQSQSVLSEGLHVSPLKIYFGSESNTASLKVVNDNPDTISLQLEAMTWFQDEEGQDQYAPTTDIIFFPKILSVKANEKRIIRVGYQGEPVGSLEQNYRLYLQQLPVEKPGEISAKFVVRMGIPIFIRPAEEVIQWEFVAETLVEKGFQIRVNNIGTGFLMVGAMDVTGRDAAGEKVFSASEQGWYVLAQKRRSFVVPVDKQFCDQASTLEVSITANRETRNRQVDASSIDCSILKSPGSETQRVMPGNS